MKAAAFQPLGFSLGLPFQRQAEDELPAEAGATVGDDVHEPIEEAAPADEPTEASTPPETTTSPEPIMPTHATPESVLALIVANGGELSAAELSAKLKGVSQSQRKYAIRTLVKGGQLTTTGKTTNIVYHVVHGAPTPRASAGAARARHPGKNPDVIAQAEAAEAVLQALQFSANVAQDALDAYLHSIADPAVLAPLRAARDSTRAALMAYTGQAA